MPIPWYGFPILLDGARNQIPLRTLVIGVGTASIFSAEYHANCRIADFTAKSFEFGGLRRVSGPIQGTC